MSAPPLPEVATSLRASPILLKHFRWQK